MKKLDIEIKRCNDCPYRQSYPEEDGITSTIYCCEHLATYGKELFHESIYAETDTDIQIPKWCPLGEVKRIVQVGIGIVIINKRKEVLLGKRQGSHGEGEWSLPGGKPNFGEKLITAAKRETFEETGLIIRGLVPLIWADNCFKEEGLHFATLFYLSKNYKGRLQRKEPHKCEKWNWFKSDSLPSPLFYTLEHVLKKCKNEIF